MNNKSWQSLLRTLSSGRHLPKDTTRQSGGWGGNTWRNHGTGDKLLAQPTSPGRKLVIPSTSFDFGRARPHTQSLQGCAFQVIWETQAHHGMEGRESPVCINSCSSWLLASNVNNPKLLNSLFVCYGNKTFGGWTKHLWKLLEAGG